MGSLELLLQLGYLHREILLLFRLVGNDLGRALFRRRHHQFRFVCLPVKHPELE